MAWRGCCQAVLMSLLLLALATLAVCDSRVKDLLLQQSRSKDGVIRMDDRTFGKLMSGDRTYAVAIFFDAVKLRSKSELRLDELRDEFGIVAKSIRDATRGTDLEGKLFLLEMEYANSEKAFRKYGINSLPNMYVIPGGKDAKERGVDQAQFPRLAQGMADFIQTAVDFQIPEIKRPPLITTMQLVVLLTLFAMSIPFVIRILLTTRTPFHDSRFWCLFGLLVYFFAVSGGLYNIIRHMPMYTREREMPHRITYFSQGSGHQLGVEGFSVGGAYCLVGLLLALATHGLPHVRNTNLQRLLMLCSLGACLWATRWVIATDNWKTGYAIHGYWPKSWR